MVANIEPRQFFDDYLLGENLAKWTEPRRWQRLNAAERALLARHLQRPGLLRDDDFVVADLAPEWQRRRLLGGAVAASWSTRRRHDDVHFRQVRRYG